MHPSADPALVELRRWAIDRASILYSKFDGNEEMLDIAQAIEDWVLRDDEEGAA